MNNLSELQIENQNLKEIIEVGKQITTGLNIKHIIKNVNYIISSKFNAEYVAFILPTDFDDFSPDSHFYNGINKIDWDLKFPTLEPLLNYLKNQEFNQISYKQFHRDFQDPLILKEIAKNKPDFLLPLKTDKEIVGVYLQGKKKDSSAYTIEDIQFCINIINFASIAIENANLYRTATIDRMTKLFTHHQFKKRLEEEIVRGMRYGKIFSVIFFDIDKFKNINDTYGHLQGDIIIKEIARLLMESIREVDYAARYGGEEFAVILPEIPLLYAAKIAERLRIKIENHKFQTSEKVLNVTISIGVAEYISEYVKYIENIIEAADKALYHSKQSGRNKVSLANYITEPSLYD